MALAPATLPAFPLHAFLWLPRRAPLALPQALLPAGLGGQMASPEHTPQRQKKQVALCISGDRVNCQGECIPGTLLLWRKGLPSGTPGSQQETGMILEGCCLLSRLK